MSEAKEMLKKPSSEVQSIYQAYNGNGKSYNEFIDESMVSNELRNQEWEEEMESEFFGGEDRSMGNDQGEDITYDVFHAWIRESDIQSMIEDMDNNQEVGYHIGNYSKGHMAQLR